jgi:Protein of unknown function (DUF3768)
MCNPGYEDRPVSDDERAKQIAEMNDSFRLNFYVPCFGPRAVPGHVLCTAGIAALPPETQICIWAEVANFEDFTEDDIHGEHDFGVFRMKGLSEKVFWKIDYYADKSCSFGSEDPADPARTFRVLTIMLASEY